MRKIGKVVVVLFSLLLLSSVVLAASSRGIVTGDSSSIVIERNGATLPCQRGELLYEGDILRGPNAASVEVEWHPYARAEMISSAAVKVVYQPPGAMDMAIYKVKEFFGFAERESQAQYAATRAGENEQLDIDVYPRPGFKATVIKGYPVTFIWGDSQGKELLVENSKKEVVFKKALAGVSSIELLPEELRLKVGEEYTWRIEGMYDVYKIRLADAGVAKEIVTGLEKIDAGEGSVNEKLLSKAAYLQMISDDRPNAVDMYWLSYQVLTSIKVDGDAELAKKVAILKKRFSKHLENTM